MRETHAALRSAVIAAKDTDTLVCRVCEYACDTM